MQCAIVAMQIIIMLNYRVKDKWYTALCYTVLTSLLDFVNAKFGEQHYKYLGFEIQDERF